MGCFFYTPFATCLLIHNVHMKWILQMGTVQSNRQKLENGNTAWVFLLECNFCSINFLKVEMETASIKSTNYFGAVLSDISRLFPLHVAFLSFTCILETVVNHSENASGLHFSPVKVYVHCRIHNTHIYWCFKKQILKIPPLHTPPQGEHHDPKPPEHLRRNAL